MKIEDIFNIENWEKASMEDLMKSLDNRDKFRYVFLYQNLEKKISPLSLYELLKVKFGVANGVSMILKSPTTENLIHWHYTLLSGNIKIHFLGKSSGVEVIVKSEKKVKIIKNDWEVLISNLNLSYSKYGKQMKKIRSDFQKYTLFINPFTRLKETLKSLVNELNSIDLTEVKKINQFTATEEQTKKYYEKLNQWIKNIERSVALGTTIRMLSPVLAESFINLLILVLSKKEFKKDKRLYENLIRQQIDIRVKTLHLNCNGFSKPVLDSDSAFKNFHSLMNNRNDFLHGNIDPTRLMFEDVYFDFNNIPLFKKDEGIIRKTMNNYLNNVEPEKANNDYETAKIFIDFVLKHLEEDIRKYIEHLLITRMPGYNNKTKKIGILFPNTLVE